MNKELLIEYLNLNRVDDKVIDVDVVRKEFDNYITFELRTEDNNGNITISWNNVIMLKDYERWENLKLMKRKIENIYE